MSSMNQTSMAKLDQTHAWCDGQSCELCCPHMATIRSDSKAISRGMVIPQ